MRSDAKTVAEYLDGLPEERKKPVRKLRDLINKNLPDGFQETMNYGMIGYVVPHSIYPAGYHCDPKQALPFMSLASQKNYIAVYHSGVYADPGLYKWFTEEYAKVSQYKLDMGKSCIRFKRMNDIPYELIEELATKLSVKQYIDMYESAIKSRA